MQSISDHNPHKDFDTRYLRNILGEFATGVTVLGCTGDDGPAAMTANAFTSVSLTPPLVLVSIGTKARMLKRLTRNTAHSINFLSGHQEPMARHYGGSKLPADDAHWATVEGVPIIAEAVASLGCQVVARHRHGDHVLVVSAVQWIVHNPDRSALTFHRGQFGALPMRQIDRPH